MSAGWRYAIALVIGFAAAWYIQGLRWSAAADSAQSAADTAKAEAVDKVNADLQAAIAQTERNRQTYLQDLKEKDDALETLRGQLDGPQPTKRVYIRANCPAVPAASSAPGRTPSGTAELDPVARQAYLDLQRGLDRQLRDLRLCRQELIDRSAK